MGGQGYDNGANMKGKHSGLQARILQINPRAPFVPCAAHTLNWVVNDSCKVSFQTFDFFRLFRNFTNFGRVVLNDVICFDLRGTINH